MLNMTTGLMAKGFSDLFARGQSDQVLARFFSTLNQYQNLLHILDVTSNNANIIYRRIHQLANKEYNGSGSGAKISGIGKGGVMLFAVPYGHHREEMEEMINSLKTEMGRDLWLDYASWQDGIGKEEGRLEQDIDSNLISPFLAHDTVKVRLFSYGVVTDRIVANECYSELLGQADIALDKTTGKVLIAGQPLTSKELPSQKAAVEILSTVLDAPGYHLDNTKIKSSYGTNRYDLHGKIVIPLVKYVKKLVGKDLQLSVSGGLYDGYQIKLDPSNISIVILNEKL
jgi:hypothetical protein